MGIVVYKRNKKGRHLKMKENTPTPSNHHRHYYQTNKKKETDYTIAVRM